MMFDDRRDRLERLIDEVILETELEAVRAALVARAVTIGRDPRSWPWPETAAGIAARQDFEAEAMRRGSSWWETRLAELSADDLATLDRFAREYNARREPDGTAPTQQALADALGVSDRRIRQVGWDVIKRRADELYRKR